MLKLIQTQESPIVRIFTLYILIYNNSFCNSYHYTYFYFPLLIFNLRNITQEAHNQKTWELLLKFIKKFNVEMDY
jgi:hypothetical protein